MTPQPLVLVLGSGVSCPSGMPLVRDITEKLFEKRHRTSSQIMDYSSGPEYVSGGAFEGYAEKCQCFLRLLRDLAKGHARVAHQLRAIEESARGRSAPLDRRQIERSFDQAFAEGKAGTPPEPNYEDLLFMCMKVEEHERGLSVDPTDTPFIEKVRSLAAAIPSTEPGLTDLAWTAREARLLILSVVRDALDQVPDSIQGLDIVVALARAPWVKDLTVVTFNHDVLVERLLRAHGLTVESGFSVADGDACFLDTGPLFGPGGRRVVRVVKLHGSVDWHWAGLEANGGGARGPYQLMRVDRESINQGNRVHGAGGSVYRIVTPIPHILTGGNKELEYNSSLYAHLQDAFHEALRRTDRVLVAGFGWNDRGAADRLRTWLDEDGKTLAFSHENPGDELDRSRWGSALDSNVGRGGRFVPVTKWFQDLKIEDLAKAFS